MSTATYQRMARGPRTRQEPGAVCVRCGASMFEADRLTEGGCTYIWYECSDADCSEQWLTKKVARMM